MNNLPQAFIDRMAAQLGDELPAFLCSYEEPYKRGIRFNPLKGGKSLAGHIQPGEVLEPVPWEENGCYDPRITEIDGEFIIMYGSHNNILGTRLGIVKTTDFIHFERVSNASEVNNRNGALFPEKITLDEYAGLVLAESPDIEVLEYEGLKCFEYAADGSDGTEYCYFATVFETDDAFWLIQFATETEKYEEALPSFIEWAKTITFE